MIALSGVAQRPIDSLVSSIFFATTIMLLLSGCPHMFGGSGRRILGISLCAAYSLSSCDSLSLGFAAPELFPFTRAS